MRFHFSRRRTLTPLVATLALTTLAGCRTEPTLPGPAADGSGFSHGHSVGQRPGEGPAVGESIRHDWEQFGAGDVQPR
ncbi:MAG: hypothetical protein HKO59_13290 [Phycisphaerales bacterium]|nr:hypothetical protein [Phycisphaerae bacterium]NNF42294.1 hypothetical protein [Phycisphaerales bacterium]NNM26936.1 hypothetical protein [Phycisphaerales bacterium]